MTHFCAFCDQELKDKDTVTAVIVTEYKRIPSKVAFAIRTDTIVVLPETLAHKEGRSPYYET